MLVSHSSTSILRRVILHRLVCSNVRNENLIFFIGPLDFLTLDLGKPLHLPQYIDFHTELSLPAQQSTRADLTRSLMTRIDTTRVEGYQTLGKYYLSSQCNMQGTSSGSISFSFENDQTLSQNPMDCIKT